MSNEKRPSNATDDRSKRSVEESSIRSTMKKVAPKRVARNVTSIRWTIEARELRRQVLLTLVLCVIMILAMLVINNWDLFKGIKDIDKTIWEVFFSVFGLIYAIIMGLIIIEVLKRWHELSSTINSEINSIGDIHDCIAYFDDNKNMEAKQEITESLRTYIELMEKNWDFMKKLKREDNTEQYENMRYRDIFGKWWATSLSDYRIERFRERGILNIIKSVRGLKPVPECEQHALGAIINKMCELATHRANRIELAAHNLTFPFYLFYGFISVVLAVGVLLLNVGHDVVHGLIVFATTTALTGLFLLLYDLDRPFDGYHKIEKESSLKDIKAKLSEVQ